MKKTLFVSDLDNTLLFSWKKRQVGDICVEKKDETEQGFMTEFTYHSLETINKITDFVPVTSRSVNQYQRIQWNSRQFPEYALAANGGVLIKNGNIDLQWLKKSKELVKPYESEMLNLCRVFDDKDKFKVSRIIDELYFYIHCYDEVEAAEIVEKNKVNSQFEVILQGKKVYFFPPFMNKGTAVERLKSYFSDEKVIAAGDSVIDIPMLQKADYAIIPEELKNAQWNEKNEVKVCDEKEFSNFVCRQVLNICAEDM